MSQLNYDKLNGLIPAIVQDPATKNVLMIGFMTPEAYEKTVSTGKVTFFSRKSKKLWTKGEKSGNFLNVISIHEDCDHDSILIYAKPDGPTCHKGSDTCFNETNKASDDILCRLEKIIKDRRDNPKEDSYTSKLFHKGINKIAQKVGEEAVELVIEAKDSDRELFIGEAADLLFHYMILLQAKGFNLDDVKEKLKSRYVERH